MREKEGNKDRPKGGGGNLGLRRNRPRTVAAEHNSGELFLWPGGGIRRGSRGKTERGERASKGRARGGQGCLQSRAIKEEHLGQKLPWTSFEGDDVSMASSNFSFLFIFLFSLITFELGLQIKSNKFVKICKIPNIQNKHLGTIFGKIKITKIPFLSSFSLYGYLWIFQIRVLNIPNLFN